MLVLMEIAEELAQKNCELQVQWIRGDINQLADDLTNEEFKEFDSEASENLQATGIVATSDKSASVLAAGLVVARPARSLFYLLLSSWRCLGMVVGYRS